LRRRPASIRENLSEEVLAVFDLLTKPELDLNKKRSKKWKRWRKTFWILWKWEAGPRWRKRQQSRASVRLTIETVLINCQEHIRRNFISRSAMQFTSMSMIHTLASIQVFCTCMMSCSREVKPLLHRLPRDRSLRDHERAKMMIKAAKKINNLIHRVCNNAQKSKSTLYIIDVVLDKKELVFTLLCQVGYCTYPESIFAHAWLSCLEEGSQLLHYPALSQSPDLPGFDHRRVEYQENWQYAFINQLCDCAVVIHPFLRLWCNGVVLLPARFPLRIRIPSLESLTWDVRE